MNWLQRFMYGRYGVDQLSIALLVFYLILNLVISFIPVPFLMLLPLAVMVFCFYRIFSRNYQKRYNENQKFLHVFNPVIQYFKLLGRKMHDRKTHRYYSCPQCKHTLRVPRTGKKILITCPVCKNEFIKKT